MNHSPEFWGLLQEIYPEMSESKLWLKKNGTSFHKFGATF